MLLSIIIPTHNRERYARSAILAALDLGADVEVVVTDSSTGNELQDWLRQNVADARLKYVRTDIGFTVVDNFNSGLLNSSGDYLCFLGDDDFVDSSILDVARWAKDSAFDVVQSTLPASYYWPDFKSRIFGDGYSSKLAVGKYTGGWGYINCAESLNNALDNLGGGVMKMPRAYLGLISRELVKSISNKWGNLFGGVSPDIYSACLISCAANKAVLVDYPFIVPGSSGASTSGLSAMGKHNGALRENPHIAPFKNLVWNELIPEYYSVPTVWSYSLVEACRCAELDVRPNYGRLYFKCFVENPTYFKYVYVSIKKHINYFGLVYTLSMLSIGAGGEIFQQIRRVVRRLFRPKATADAFVLDQVPDCKVASERMRRYLERGQPLLLKND